MVDRRCAVTSWSRGQRVVQCGEFVLVPGDLLQDRDHVLA